MPPHFFCIGAMKSGTTWLYFVLKKHPEIWLPPIKELHYYDMQGEKSHIKQIITKTGQYRASRRRLKYMGKKNLIKSPFFYFKYFFRRRNPDYYYSLFSPKESQICGEMTPHYAVLDLEIIKKIHSNHPKLKIIYLLRNPIERDWSQLCMTMKNTFNLPDFAWEQVPEKLCAKTKKNSEYLKHLDNWLSYYDKSQIFIGFFDELRDNPQLFLSKIYDFLEVCEGDAVKTKALLHKKINSYSKEIPRETLIKLASSEYENIKKIHQYFQNNHTLKWYEQVSEILGK